MTTDLRLLLTLTRRADGWWIASHLRGVDDMGPYRTRVEAAEDRHGVLNHIRRNRRHYLKHQTA